MDDEKLEREAAKILFSAPTQPEEVDVVGQEPTGAEIPFVCPFCNETYQVSEELAGKKINCRNCHEPCRVDGKEVHTSAGPTWVFWLGVATGIALSIVAVALLKIARLL